MTYEKSDWVLPMDGTAPIFVPTDEVRREVNRKLPVQNLYVLKVR
jgi:hypothetical protein